MFKQQLSAVAECMQELGLLKQQLSAVAGCHTVYAGRGSLVLTAEHCGRAAATGSKVISADCARENLFAGRQCLLSLYTLVDVTHYIRVKPARFQTNSDLDVTSLLTRRHD